MSENYNVLVSVCFTMSKSGLVMCIKPRVLDYERRRDYYPKISYVVTLQPTAFFME